MFGGWTPGARKRTQGRKELRDNCFVESEKGVNYSSVLKTKTL